MFSTLQERFDKLTNSLIDRAFPNTSRSSMLRNFLVKATGGTFLLRLFVLGTGFITSIILARLLGVAEYGLYSYALSIAMLFSIASILGFNRLLVRETAKYRSKEDWQYMTGLLLYTIGVTVVSSLGILLFVQLAGSYIIEEGIPGLIRRSQDVVSTDTTRTLRVVMLAFILVPFVSLELILSSTMQGLNRIVQGQMPSQLIKPAIKLGTLVLLLLFAGFVIRSEHVLLIVIGSSVVSVIVGSILLFHYLPKHEMVSVRNATFDMSLWLTGLPFFVWLGILGVAYARADILILGTIGTKAEVGLYTIAYTLANLVTMVHAAANVTLAPTFSEFYAAKKFKELQQVVVKSARTILLTSLPIIVGLILLGRFVLRIYGAEFVEAYPALVIMVVGQTISLSAGAVGHLLLMTGYERELAFGRTIGLVVNLALNLTLIPLFGILGAALAWAISLAVWNGILTYFVWNKLGFLANALGRLK